MRVLDISTMIAAPFSAALLADFGAQVIKIEYARRMDGMRGGRKENQAYDHHPRWLEINRNKLSITLDLKARKDVAVFKDLVRISDVVVESSRVGVLKGFGLGYDTLRALRPDLILLSMSGFGQTGPEASYAGYGGCLEPLSGIQGLTAYAPESRPVRVREVDVTNGVMGACALMTALFHRQRTGEGQWIDLSQLEACTFGLIGEQLLAFAANGAIAQPRGNRHECHAPQGCYRCSGDDRWVALVVRSDAEWKRLCDAVGWDGPRDDPRFATEEGRRHHHDEIDRLIEAWTATRTQEEVMTRLQQARLAAGAVLDVASLARDPHLAQRGFLRTARDGNGVHPGLPFVLPEGGGDVWRRGPRLGEHLADVLCALLGRPESDAVPPEFDKIGTAFDID